MPQRKVGKLGGWKVSGAWSTARSSSCCSLPEAVANSEEFGRPTRPPRSLPRLATPTQTRSQSHSSTKTTLSTTRSQSNPDEPQRTSSTRHPRSRSSCARYRSPDQSRSCPSSSPMALMSTAL